MEVMFDVGPGVKCDAGAVHSMSIQAQERRTLSARRGKGARENVKERCLDAAGARGW
jgi:hypothetical protein